MSSGKPHENQYLSYNQRTFLKKAIDSVPEQDRPDVEHIVVDPGSTDGRRVFLQIRGRDWRASDDVLRFLYRVEGLLIQTRLWPRYSARKKGAA